LPQGIWNQSGWGAGIRTPISSWQKSKDYGNIYPRNNDRQAKEIVEINIILKIFNPEEVNQ